MPTISNDFSTLINIIYQNPDKDFLVKLLNAVLTDKERAEIGKRLQIFHLLGQGLPQREISERLGVGIATVSRGAKAFEHHNINQLLPDLGGINH